VRGDGDYETANQRSGLGDGASSIYWSDVVKKSIFYLVTTIFILWNPFTLGESRTAYAKETVPFMKTFVSLLSLDGKKLDRNKRLDVARSFANACTSIMKKIPSLSPNENKWLDNEFKQGRIMSAAESSEMIRRELRSSLNTCSEQLSEINLHIEPAKEALIWVSFVKGFTHPEVFKRFIKYGNNKANNLTDDERHFFNYMDHTRYLILQHFVIPVLAVASADGQIIQK
jgi:hypothetical protein